MRYLLDTNICIYIIKKEPASALRKFKELKLGDIGISTVTLAELYYGVEKSQHKEKNRLALETFILPLEVAPFDENACLFYGKLRSQLESIGNLIGALDLMIAAHAKSLNAILVTNNSREFSRISELKIENWV